jgi:hypothetical protein
MELKLPVHFQQRMQERGIQIDHVKKAIREPDKKKTVFEGRIRVSKKLEDNRTIEVVYCKEGFRDKPNQFIVITAYYL